MGYRTGFPELKAGFTTFCAVIKDLCLGIPFRAIQVGLNRINAFLALNFGIKIIKEKAGEKPDGKVEQGGGK